MVGAAGAVAKGRSMTVLTAKFTKTLADFTLQVEFDMLEGVTALFGPSGSGKTQLARILCGLEIADTGNITLNERVLSSPEGTALKSHQRRIAMVFQDHLLFPHKTVRGNLLYGQPDNSRYDFKEIVQSLDIEHILDRKPAQLSGGEQQRVAIGRALLSEPELLIMDEPLSNLDHSRKADILTLIERIRDQFGISILYITHALDEVLRLADHIILLEAGHVRACGSLGDILSRHDVMLEKSGIGIGSVFEGIVFKRDERHQLITINSPAGDLMITEQLPMQIGQQVRIRIRARDVSIALSRISDISTINQFKCVIKNIIDNELGTSIVALDAGVPLNASITQKSRHDLNLKPGDTVWALVKSVTVNSIEQ
jgi:molybdate transport system ATP-binding protein